MGSAHPLGRMASSPTRSLSAVAERGVVWEREDGESERIEARVAAHLPRWRAKHLKRIERDLRTARVEHRSVGGGTPLTERVVVIHGTHRGGYTLHPDLPSEVPLGDRVLSVLIADRFSDLDDLLLTPSGGELVRLHNVCG